MPKLDVCRLGLLALCVLVSACHDRSGDEDLPTPATALGCPDLNGTYQLSVELGPNLNPSHWLTGAETKSWQSFSLQSVVPGSPIHVSLRREPSSIQAEVESFRSSQPDAYKRWRDKASLSYIERGVARRAHYEALAELGPTPEEGFSTDSGICLDNWFQFPAEASEHDDHRAFALDENGNLLIRSVHTTREEFPIWCGDGCKGIPYAWHTQVTWARAKRLPDAKPWVWTRDAGEPEAGPPGDPSGHDDRDPRVNDLRQRMFAALPEGATMYNFYMRSDGVIYSGTARTRTDLESIKRFLGRDPLVDTVIERRAWETNRGDIEFALEIPLKAP